VILLADIAWQLHAIVRAEQPAVGAIVALASTVPLFVLCMTMRWATPAIRQWRAPPGG
jgi:hypothetical protein